jgi:hypothetical protein
MEGIRRFLVAFAVLAVFCFLISILFVSALYAFAIFAPLMGLSYLGARLAAANELWKSHGRFPIGDGVRIIGAGRARSLALLFCVEGAAGFALSFVPALFAFNAKVAIVPLFLISLGAQVAARVSRGRVLAGAHAVDVLPPE